MFEYLLTLDLSFRIHPRIASIFRKLKEPPKLHVLHNGSKHKACCCMYTNPLPAAPGAAILIFSHYFATALLTAYLTPRDQPHHPSKTTELFTKAARNLQKLTWC